MIHRQRLKSDVWHWNTDCSNYPTKPGTFTQVNLPHDHGVYHPQVGEQCNQCRAKDKRAGRTR